MTIWGEPEMPFKRYDHDGVRYDEDGVPPTITSADVSEDHGVEMLSRVTFVLILAFGALTLLWFILSAVPDLPAVTW